jgi:hypothetical protein
MALRAVLTPRCAPGPVALTCWRDRVRHGEPLRLKGQFVEFGWPDERGAASR